MTIFVRMKSQPKNKATGIRLKELKAPLQREAMKQDRSLNGLIFKILKEFVNLLK